MYKLAIARKRSLPYVEPRVYASAEEAITEMMTRYEAEAAARAALEPGQPAPRTTGDYCVIPADAAPDGVSLSSDQVRAAAVSTTMGWHQPRGHDRLVGPISAGGYRADWRATLAATGRV